MIIIQAKQIPDGIAALTLKAQKVLGLSGNMTVELEMVGQTKIKRLNSGFRGIDKATDVLSFPLLNLPKPTATKLVLPAFNKKNYPLETNAEGTVMLGSIVICTAVAKKNAVRFNHSYERELCYLFTHGLLHLLGFDHIDGAEQRIMRIAEESILKQIGLTRE